MPRVPNYPAIPQADDIEEFKFANMSKAVELARARSRALEDPDPDPYGYAQELEQKYSVNLLDPQWKAKPSDPLWKRRSKKRARKVAVARLYLQGHDVSEIAKRCKVAESTVVDDIKAIAAEWRKTYLDDTEVLAAPGLGRLGSMFKFFTPG